MAHSFTQLLAHVIFSTKDRAPFIDGELKDRLYPYMGGIIRELGGHLLTINGPPDHVHLLVRLPGTQGVADVLCVRKANASRWVHETWPGRQHFGWQVGYGAFSVSLSNADDVRAYITNQEAHHHRMTFQEEFIAFLERHAIEYDERYVWE